MIQLLGKPVAKSIEENIKNQIDALKQKHGSLPGLVTILVGNNPASEAYIKMKLSAAERVGIPARALRLSEDTTTEQLLEEINKLNNDKMVAGIMLQHPAPKHINEQKCFNAISLNKDVDGTASSSFGEVAFGGNAFAAATPKAIVNIINYYGIKVEGKHAVVVGRSAILGKPVSALLLNMDATVTICHRKTQNLESHLKCADIVVACCGKPNYIKGESLKDGVIILDAGYNVLDGKCVGDVDYASASQKAGAITPVPGGVGPVTIASLLENTLTSIKNML